MIFDDHDVRDDWNTSYAWQQDIRRTSWWHERIVSGLRVLLGLPARRQPLARRARRRPGVAADRGARRTAAATDELDLTAGARRPRRAGRRGPDDVPVELRPRLRRRPARRRGLPRRPGPRAGPALAARRRGARLARRADARRREAPVRRYVAAVPAADRAALPGGVERGRRQRRLGPAVRDVRREAASRRRPRALGRVPARLPRGGADGPGGRGRAPREGPEDGDVPVRRRAPLLRLRGGPPALGRQQPDHPGWSARRSATRCRARCGSPRRCWPTRSPGRSASSSPGPRRCRTRRSAGTTSPARGSTTASRCSRTATTASPCSWLTGVVEDDDHEHPRLDTVADVLHRAPLTGNRRWLRCGGALAEPPRNHRSRAQW